MSKDRDETVFRSRWREHHAAGSRPGELIREPGWIDAALVGLGVLVAAGAVATSTLTVEQTLTLPAAADGAVVIAVRGDATPEHGARGEYRDAEGATVAAVVVDVTATEVTARLAESGPDTSGDLLIPAGRQRLVGILLAGLA